MARMSVWDDIQEERPRPTLPVFQIADIDIEREAKEAAARVSERRTIRNGRDAWEAITKVETLEQWFKIAAALHVGKLRAIRVTRSNAGWGSAYSKEFGRWCREFGFTMPKQVRSWAILLHENAQAIEQWRSHLSECERKRLVNPQSVVKRWQRDTQHGRGRCPTDLKRDAVAAWKRFVSCAAMLPPDQARPLWQAVAAEAAAMAHA